jgi:hypothetical protein
MFVGMVLSPPACHQGVGLDNHARWYSELTFDHVKSGGRRFLYVAVFHWSRNVRQQLSMLLRLVRRWRNAQATQDEERL